MLRFTRTLLLVLNGLNWVAALFFVVMLALLLAEPAWMAAKLVRSYGAAAALARSSHAAFTGIGLLTVGCAHVILIRLVRMVDAVTAGQPFAAANARRLRDIAWALLGIQLLDLLFGWIAVHFMTVTHRVAPWAPGLTGWIAVLLLFVLARVFRQGAAMQDELEGTV